MPLSQKRQVNPAMPDSFALKPRADSSFDHQIHCALLKHAGAHAIHDVILASILDNDRIDSFQVQQMAQKQSRRTCADNSDLGPVANHSGDYIRAVRRTSDMIETILKTGLQRRDFLRIGCLAPFAVNAAPERSIRKAIMYETLKIRGSVLEKFQAVKAAGFAGVEPMSHMGQSEVREALESSGLAAASVCCATHWKSPLSDASAAVRDTGRKGLEQALRDAKLYGASSVLLVPAVVNQQVAYDAAYKRSQEEIRKVLPLARELGVKIAIENVWNHFIMTPLEAARYIDEFESDSIGWHFDVGNSITFGWPEQWIRILGKRILKLHIKEYSREKAAKTGASSGFAVKFLEGDNNWPAVMKALDDAGYRGWGIAEQPGADSPEGLKDLSERMDRIFAS